MHNINIEFRERMSNAYAAAGVSWMEPSEVLEDIGFINLAWWDTDAKKYLSLSAYAGGHVEYDLDLEGPPRVSITGEDPTDDDLKTLVMQFASTTSTGENRVHALKYCSFCQASLDPAPTDRSWVGFSGGGMHLDCIKELNEICDAVIGAEVLETAE